MVMAFISDARRSRVVVVDTTAAKNIAILLKSVIRRETKVAVETLGVDFMGEMAVPVLYGSLL